MHIEYRALGGIGANCFFVTVDHETAIIDPGYITPWLMQKVEEYNNIKYILLTHRHADHLMGLHSVKSKTHAKVAIHELDAQATVSPEISLCEEIYGKTQTPVKADILLEDGDRLPLGSKEFQVIHTPGHSAGSVCFIMEDRIFSGDTIFKGSVGRTDLPSGDYGQMIDSVKKIFALEGDYILYPGHGESTTLDFERVHNSYFGRAYDLSYD